jgi:hypothetical protein
MTRSESPPKLVARIDGAPEPDMPPFDESKYEPMVEVEV